MTIYISLFKKYKLYSLNINRLARKSGLSKYDFKRIKLAILLSYIGCLASIPFAIIDLLQRKWWLLIVELLCLIMCLATLSLLRNGKFILGRVVFFILGNLLAVLYASYMGQHSGNQFLVLLLMIGAPLLFSKQEIKFVILLSVLAFSSFIFLEVTDYSYFFHSPNDPDFSYLKYLICFFLSYIVLTTYILKLDSINDKSEKKLKILISKLMNKNYILKKTNDELDSFVYKTSHNMRSPLTTLRGLVELMENEKDPEIIKHYLSLEKKTIHKLDTYIIGIMDILHNSRLALNNDSINLKEIIDSLILESEFSELSNSIIIETDINENVFISDFMRLHLLMKSLIINSIKFSDDSKKQKLIYISSYLAENCCTIKIRDNGIGIKKEHLNNIFNMYYKGNDRMEGSGLGLYIVKEIVDKLKGSINVKSEFGKWTEFTVCLPCLIQIECNSKKIEALNEFQYS